MATKTEHISTLRGLESSPRKVHWVVPATIAGFLLLGIVTAIAHHCLYQAFDGTVVASENQQRWLLRAGTALAFLSKMSLAISTGSSYVQQLWLTVSRRPSRIDHLDGMFDILKDATGFLAVMSWVLNPLLALTAIVTWCMPITAILTPGTLTVRLQPHSTDQALQVPTLDTTGTKLYFLSDSGAAIFGGPTTAVSRTAISAMTQGLISSLQPQYPNSSYTLNVFAPAISCKSWDSATTKSFKSSLCDSFRGTWCSADTSLYLQKPGLRYMSWVHQPGAAGYNETNPPLGPLLNASEAYPFDWTAGDLLLYIAQRDYSYPENAPDVLLTCSLLNASYTADFSFQNNRQTVAVKKREFTAFSSFQAYSYTESGDPLIWSYGAMWTAFTTTFLGYMTYPVSVREGLPPTIMQTQIQNTPLNPLPDPTYSLINIRSSTTYAEMIEELFTNVTLSYFSNPALTTNSSSSPTVPVTYATYQNHYAYEPQSLWIAYGTGIGLSLLCALVGARAIIVSGATFTNSWSTIFRTTRAPELRNILDDTPEAMDGAQPTPHRVRQAVVVYLKYCGFQLASHAKSIAAGQVDFDEEQTGTEQEMTTAEESATHHSEHDSPQIASATTDAHSGIGRLDAGPTNSEAITPTMEEAHPATERVDAPSTTRDTAEPSLESAETPQGTAHGSNHDSQIQQATNAEPNSTRRSDDRQ